jgi:hypothetical protein
MHVHPDWLGQLASDHQHDLRTEAAAARLAASIPARSRVALFLRRLAGRPLVAPAPGGRVVSAVQQRR